MKASSYVSALFAAAFLVAPVVAAALPANAALPAQVSAHSAPACPGPADPGSARCHALVRTDADGVPAFAKPDKGATGNRGGKGGGGGGGSVPPPPAGALGPVQFRTAYGLTGLSGSGKTIAIVDAYDNPNIENDLAVYSAAYNLPSCTTANGCFTKVDQNGGKRYPTANSGWALEIALDVQTAHAVCPDCKILLVEARSASLGNLLTAELYALAHADVVSNSWGASEFSSENSYDQYLTKPGVPVTVSSGDYGYGAQWPAASNAVTAVGGTTLLLNPDNTRASETAWSDAGSGCSAYAPKPAWQTDSDCANRTIADVSAVADPATGAAVYDSYGYNGHSGWFQVGGTSLSSPLVAAIYALAGNTTGASALYAHASSLYDVTIGSNGTCGGSYLCTAALGYDGPTGLGSPNGILAFLN